MLPYFQTQILPILREMHLANSKFSSSSATRRTSNFQCSASNYMIDEIIGPVSTCQMCHQLVMRILTVMLLSYL